MADNFKELLNGTLDESDFTDGVATILSPASSVSQIVKDLKSRVRGAFKTNLTLTTGGFELTALDTHMSGTEIIPGGTDLSVKDEGLFPQLRYTDTVHCLADANIRPIEVEYQNDSNSRELLLQSRSETELPVWSTTTANISYYGDYGFLDNNSAGWFRYSDGNSIDVISILTIGTTFTGDYNSNTYFKSVITDKYAVYHHNNFYLNSCKFSTNSNGSARHSEGSMSTTYDLPQAAGAWSSLAATDGDTPTFLYISGSASPRIHLWIPGRKRDNSMQALDTGLDAESLNRRVSILTETDTPSELCYAHTVANNDVVSLYRFEDCATGDTTNPSGYKWKDVNLRTLAGLSSSYDLENIKFGAWPLLYGAFEVDNNAAFVEYDIVAETSRIIVENDSSLDKKATNYFRGVTPSVPTSLSGTPSGTSIDLRVVGIESEETS